MKLFIMNRVPLKLGFFFLPPYQDLSVEMCSKSHVHFPTIALLTLVVELLLPIGGLVHSKRGRKPALSRPQGSPRIHRLLVKKNEHLYRNPCEQCLGIHGRRKFF